MMHTYSLKTPIRNSCSVPCAKRGAFFFSSDPQEHGWMKDLFLIPDGVLKISQVLSNLYNSVLRVLLGCQCPTVKAPLNLLFIYP